MRVIVVLGVLSVIAIGLLAGLFFFSAGSGPESLAPRPADNYLLRPADAAEAGLKLASAGGQSWESTLLALGDAYPERDRSALSVLDAMGSTAADGSAARARLRGAQWVETATSLLVTTGESGPSSEVRSTASLFNSSGGASELFKAVSENPSAGVQVPGPDVGEESRWYARNPGDPSVSAVIFRRLNVVVRIAFSGSGAITSNVLLQLARMLDDKAMGERVLTRSGPFSSPTPAAQPAWVGKDGKRAAEITEMPGPARCSWQDMLIITWRGAQYVQDRAGRFRDLGTGRYEPSTDLPPAAADTGLRSGSRALWVEGTPNPDAVFVKTASGTERWPRLDQRCG